MKIILIFAWTRLRVGISLGCLGVPDQLGVFAGTPMGHLRVHQWGVWGYPKEVSGSIYDYDYMTI